MKTEFICHHSPQNPLPFEWSRKDDSLSGGRIQCRKTWYCRTLRILATRILRVFGNIPNLYNYPITPDLNFATVPNLSNSTTVIKVIPFLVSARIVKMPPRANWSTPVSPQSLPQSSLILYQIILLQLVIDTCIIVRHYEFAHAQCTTKEKNWRNGDACSIEYTIPTIKQFHQEHEKIRNIQNL
jgi:hypothetical protein